MAPDQLANRTIGFVGFASVWPLSVSAAIHTCSTEQYGQITRPPTGTSAFSVLMPVKM